MAIMLQDEPIGELVLKKIDHENKGLQYTTSMKQDVDVFARNIVNDVVGGKSGLVWRGKSSSMAWLASVLMPESMLTNMVNGNKGLEELARARRQ